MDQTLGWFADKQHNLDIVLVLCEDLPDAPDWVLGMRAGISERAAFWRGEGVNDAAALCRARVEFMEAIFDAALDSTLRQAIERGDA